MNQLKAIESKIFELRGQKVMLDRDLAQMYGVETRILNQAVKRNISRFPEDFMFQLNDEEWRNLKSQIVISSWGGVRKNPLAFTEQGVAMLSSVLKSEIAIQVNIAIMRAFVSVRKMLNQPPADSFAVLEKRVAKLEQYMDEVIGDFNDINEDTRMQLELINESLAELQTGNKKSENGIRRKIGFK